MTTRNYWIMAFALIAFQPTWQTSWATIREGGGGDAAEIRVDEIRADVLAWINVDGAKELRLPAGVGYEQYVSSMRAVLAPHAVVVGFVTTNQESNSNDPEQKVVVKGLPKTCRGFVSKKDGLPHVLCNVERFMATSAEAQYRLVHHEFAGLAGIEKNIGASSDYEVSNQLSEFLVPETVLRLSAKRLNPTDRITALLARFSAAGNGCSVVLERSGGSVGLKVDTEDYSISVSVFDDGVSDGSQTLVRRTAYTTELYSPLGTEPETSVFLAEIENTGQLFVSAREDIRGRIRTLNCILATRH